MLDRASGVYVFDIFGAFTRKISLPDLASVTDVQFQGDELFFLTSDGRGLHFEALYASAAPPRRVGLGAAPGGKPWTRAVAGPGGEVYLLNDAGLGVIAARPAPPRSERK